MNCENCVLHEENGYGVCTRQNINHIDGYCWLEQHLRECYENPGYETHDCIFCKFHRECQEMRKNDTNNVLQ